MQLDLVVILVGLYLQTPDLAWDLWIRRLIGFELSKCGLLRRYLPLERTTCRRLTLGLEYCTTYRALTSPSNLPGPRARINPIYIPCLVGGPCVLYNTCLEN